MAVHHPLEEVLLAVAHISERLCLFAKYKKSAFERVSKVTGGYIRCWISFSGTSVLRAQARGKQLIQQVSLPPLVKGVLHSVNFTLRTGPGEEVEHNKLLPNSCFGKC